MVKDYSGSCFTTNYRNKNAVYKKKSVSAPGDIFSATKLMWKSLGAMLLVTVIIGITSSIWYGWQVQQALDQIGNNRTTKSELVNENRLMIAQRDLMLSQGIMEKNAGRLGLYSPVKSQLRYP